MAKKGACRAVRRSGLPSKAFRPSASRIIGSVVSANTLWTNCCVSAKVERPGPMAMTDLPRTISSHRRLSQLAMLTVPASVVASGTVISSGMPAATMGNTSAGVATVTSPAPMRNAARPASTAAPDLPVDPATTSACPKAPLLASRLRTIGRPRNSPGSSQCSFKRGSSSSKSRGVPI